MRENAELRMQNAEWGIKGKGMSENSLHKRRDSKYYRIIMPG
jgi:hypothetical protein